MKKFSLFFFLVLICLVGCSPQHQPHSYSFYHWKSTFEPDSVDLAYLNALDVNKIYLRFFDVAWDVNEKAALPISVLKTYPDSVPLPCSIIPTVFITNEVMLKTKHEEVEMLATQIFEKIDRMWKASFLELGEQPYEVQIDCDWSLKTKDRYFKFLEELNKIMANTQVSCTIRLHQLKYADKTGVPPVDFGVLMCYNMGSLRNPDESNSILNIERTQKYFSGTSKYPLALSVALPLFSWGVHYRSKKVVGVINGLHHQDLSDKSFLKPLKNGWYKVTESQFLFDQYLYKDDMLRLEEVSYENLVEVTALLENYFTHRDWNIVYYHLDSKCLKAFEPEQLKEL